MQIAFERVRRKTSPAVVERVHSDRALKCLCNFIIHYILSGKKKQVF